ncbi:biotin-dependent carboxyltransferase family protein [Aquibacillus saliphilus]|uniref:5-oxoprolinase subunit C family protein n=1 Tax=Aquibacillus saliphilus TaxID=1909422 RepID=UPI001CF09EC6|nr:biotin-dependent carboxyltransferase family protein [Aquibacillus saliphilus]
MGIRIIEEGLLTTVQDLGRFGYQSSGFSVSGAMDSWAMQLANIILDNDKGEAVLEMSFIGPSITFEADMIISLTGADMSPKINEKVVKNGKPLSVKNGDTLTLRTAKSGIHCYLAIKGGLDLPNFLNSKSTSLRAQVGGFHGRKLVVGDIIPILTPIQAASFNWSLSPFLFDYISSNDLTIRFLEGRQYDWFTNQSKQHFETEAYQTTTQSDRMGYRLKGMPIHFIHSKELLTEATTFGTIQVPASGQPIILMADRQPTGGYPKIGQVINVDLATLSQVRPSQSFTFLKSTLKEAQTLMNTRQQQLSSLQTFCTLKWKEWDRCK